MLPVGAEHSRQCSTFGDSPECAAPCAALGPEFDPLDPDSIAQGLQRAVAAGKQSVGARRAADYSWERAVQAHADLYRELTA